VTLGIGYVFALLFVGLALFAWERLSVDTVALILLLALAIPGVLTPKEAIEGFADPTIIVLISLFVLTAGVVKTGVVERLGMRLAAVGGENPVRLTQFILIAVTVISAFFSNTVTTAVFLPIVVGLARRAALPLSRVLMPLAFASMLSSPVTLISTSTNLLISGQLPKFGLKPIGFFEMAPAGIAITVVGMLYLLYVAPRLIPDRTSGQEPDTSSLRRYLTEVVVTPNSTLHGRTLKQSQLGSTMDLNVVGVVRGDVRILAPGPEVELREGDILMIEGRAEDILLVKDAAGVEIRPDVELSAPDLQSEEVRMVEAMVLPGSPLAGRTLREAALRDRTGLTVLAVHTAGGPDLMEKISHLILKPSDVLLLQGSDRDLRRIRGDELLLLEDVSAHHPRSGRGRRSAAIFVGAVVLGATGLLPLPIAFLTGGLLMVLTRCLTPEEAYEAVNWRMMVLIGCMIAFGLAMEKTGAAPYLARLIVSATSGMGTLALLAGFYIVTSLLTQPMSNQGAALVILPVAMRVAQELSINPRTMAMMITFAASCSFLTPLEPSCILVYGPGRYRFFDFTKVGGLLTFIIFLMAMVLVPIFWPLH
jgi:di/tricarboxylate transporter